MTKSPKVEPPELFFHLDEVLYHLLCYHCQRLLTASDLPRRALQPHSMLLQVPRRSYPQALKTKYAGADVNVENSSLFDHQGEHGNMSNILLLEVSDTLTKLRVVAELFPPLQFRSS